jgi:hypothetical protein
VRFAFLILGLALLGGCASDSLNRVAVSACKGSPNCTVTDARIAGGPQQRRAIAPESQQRPH